MNFNWLIKGAKWVACAFERCTDGASARKLTMFAIVVGILFLHIIVGKIFIMGTIKETQALIWILLGFLIIDHISILLIMQILKAHDIADFINGVNKQKGTNNDNISEGDTGSPGN